MEFPVLTWTFELGAYPFLFVDHRGTLDHRGKSMSLLLLKEMHCSSGWMGSQLPRSVKVGDGYYVREGTGLGQFKFVVNRRFTTV